VRVHLVHVTRLEYTADVVEGVMDVRVGPRTDADQRVERFVLNVQPAAAVRRYADGFGNYAHLITISRPHRTLELTVESDVHTTLEDPFALPARPPDPLTPGELSDYLLPSPLVPLHSELLALAEPCRPASPEATFDAVSALSSLVHRTFAYTRHVTTVQTTVADVLAHRTGVCQDFAHVLIGLCRSIGVPARYVSGYTVADTHGDGPEASHAWVEAFTPTHGWRGFDPTNDLAASTAHIKMAIGRDYADVPPTRGTFRGVAAERLSVRVDSSVVS